MLKLSHFSDKLYDAESRRCQKVASVGVPAVLLSDLCLFVITHDYLLLIKAECVQFQCVSISVICSVHSCIVLCCVVFLCLFNVCVTLQKDLNA